MSFQDYHSLLFGSGRNVASLANNVTSSLCLPISIQEVLDMNQTSQMDATHSEVLHCISQSFVIMVTVGQAQPPINLFYHTHQSFKTQLEGVFC